MKIKKKPKMVQKAINAAGSHSAFSRDLNVSRQTVYLWTRIPVHHVLKVEELYGISRYEQRPDVYGKAPKGMKSRGVEPKNYDY